MWMKMCEHGQRCWEIYLIIPAQRCHQWRMLGGGASLFRPRLVRTTAVMLHPGNLYLLISRHIYYCLHLYQVCCGFSYLSKTNCWGHHCAENWDAGADILWQWQWDSINCVEAVTTLPRGNFVNCIWISENISTWLATRLPVIHAMDLWLITRG